ncbi:Transposase [Dyadobacter koreensis]|uniref:Transposase n=1 Tax=Dyadobacter koreensis TaxID=408657 RepID=A0A1H6T1N6_9BACT|nr:transposase [Dyadobacter koreensis]SEI70155.1 Transposase [Dyadobacter koreensis]
MKAKEKKVTVKNRKPYERLSDTEKKKIVHEINSGLIGQRAAARKYGLNRKTLGTWVAEFSSFNARPREVAEEAIGNMNENSKTRILAKQVQDLTKQLEKANLKISGLQTMIEVSEQELHIKIRKKPGSKQ